MQFKYSIQYLLEFSLRFVLCWITDVYCLRFAKHVCNVAVGAACMRGEITRANARQHL